MAEPPCSEPDSIVATADPGPLGVTEMAAVCWTPYIWIPGQFIVPLPSEFMVRPPSCMYQYPTNGERLGAGAVVGVGGETTGAVDVVAIALAACVVEVDVVATW